MLFKDKVLKLRLELNLSQETLAKELNVAFATVNRWEKGHTEPSVLTKNRFDKFCNNNGIKIE